MYVSTYEAIHNSTTTKKQQQIFCLLYIYNQQPTQNQHMEIWFWLLLLVLSLAQMIVKKNKKQTKINTQRVHCAQFITPNVFEAD